MGEKKEEKKDIFSFLKGRMDEIYRQLGNSSGADRKIGFIGFKLGRMYQAVLLEQKKKETES